MKEYFIFPRDPDTLGIIEELEVSLNFTHISSNDLSDWELKEYINQLTLISILKL